MTVKADSWPGLVTNASPFAVPLGAAVEQTNLESRIPGQLTSRGGMQVVATTSQPAAILDCYPYAVNGQTYLVAMTGTGALVSLASPAYGPEPVPPSHPSLSCAGNTVASAYTYEYCSNGEQSYIPPAPEPSAYLLSLDGGDVDDTQAYTVNANFLCAGTNKQDTFDGGAVNDDNPPPTIPLSSMCAS